MTGTEGGLELLVQGMLLVLAVGVATVVAFYAGVSLFIIGTRLAKWTRGTK